VSRSATADAPTEEAAGPRPLDLEIVRAALDDARRGLVEAMGYVHGESQGLQVDASAWASALGMVAHGLDIVAVEVEASGTQRRREERPIVPLADRIDRAGSRKRNGRSRGRR
jgi:hypothetical protein